jgi:signal transduction histidine kinase/CHASE3 domain sensor protein
MNIKALLPSPLFLKSIFVIVIFLLIFISSITYRHTIALKDSARWVMQTYKAQVQLEQLISFLKDAETGQRGFIITKDTVFLQPYRDGHEKINEAISELKKTTIDNPFQKSNLDTLSYLIDKRFKIFENTLALNRAIPFSAERLNYSVFEGKNMMDIIHRKVDGMIELESLYLNERQKKYEEDISFTPLFTLALLFFSIMVFAFSYFQINKDFDILKKANKALIIKTEAMKQAEKIGEFGTTEWNVEKNELCFSDNLYLLLGCAPHAFQATVDNYLKFVHPDDKHIIAEGAESAITDGKTYPRYYRIIRADGEIRYFKSMGTISWDALTQTHTHIGFIMDVTDTYLVTVSLEEKNRELEQSNKELASFNHIVSHDLQEPLRKIQTFVSRISQQELADLSPTSREYFVKIHVSAQKMRALIDDLLLFSRTNKVEKAFVLTDLTALLDSAKQELAEVIVEKNAVIESAILPELKVIPFQIQQLFINLIANSLKYCNSNTPPLIVISCEIINAKDDPSVRANPNSKYCKITFKDNGIGFEQQYAEKIFNLFHRLHATNTYAGTGIGLAICKKIVDNHAGFIVAQGVLDEGATFTIFLPV